MSSGKERSAAGLYYTTTYLQIITTPEYRGLEIKLTRNQLMEEMRCYSRIPPSWLQVPQSLNGLHWHSQLLCFIKLYDAWEHAEYRYLEM